VPGPGLELEQRAAFDGADLVAETIFTSARAGDLEELVAQTLDGSLPVPISRRYRLADGARACIDLLRSTPGEN
jgi:NADPH:quinone reductase